jgi:hypothetical protein
MDELTLVRELLPAAPPPAGPVVAAARDRLDASMHGRPRRRLLPAPGRRAVLLIPGVLAVTTAAVLVATTVLTGGRTDGGKTPGLPHSLIAANARQYLLTMAGTAGQARSTGRYWCTVAIQASREMIGPNDQELPAPWLNGVEHPSPDRPAGYQYSIMKRVQVESCLAPPHGSWTGGTVGGYYQSLGIRFPAAADATAWRRDGAPDHVGAWYAHQSDSFNPGPRVWTGAKTGQPETGIMPWQRNAALPADPAKLRAMFLAEVPKLGKSYLAWLEHTNGWTYQQAVDDVVFSAAVGVMAGEMVTPAVRAAAYRVLASVRGIQVRPGVRFGNGQIGTAVWLTSDQPTWTLTCVDPATSYVCGDEEITVKPVAGLPVGSVLTYDIDVSSGWTNTAPSKPAH